jgi:hypothetical protein
MHYSAVTIAALQSLEALCDGHLSQFLSLILKYTMCLKHFISKLGGVFAFALFLTIPTFGQIVVSDSSEDTCSFSRSFGNPIVIHYNSYSRCFFPVGAQDAVLSATPIYYRIVGNTEYVNIATSPESQMLQFVVPANKEVEIITKNECGADETVVKLSSKVENTGSIVTSREIFNASAAWQKNPMGLNYYEMLTALPNVSTVEKLYVLQQFLNDGLPFDDVYDNGNIPPKSAFVPVNDCSCNIMEVETMRDIRPYVDCQDLFPGFFCTVAGEQPEQEFGYKGYYKWAQEGPAKYMKAEAGRRFCSNAYGSIPGKEIGVAVLSYNLLCKDERWDPANCRCSHDVNVQYEYQSSLSTFGSNSFGFLNNCDPILFPNSEADAYADDACILMVLPDTAEINAGTFNALALDTLRRVTVYSGCNSELNKEQFGNLTGLIFDALAAGLTLTQGQDTLTAQGVNNLLQSGYIDSMANHVNNLVTDPWVFRTNENCGANKEVLYLRGGKKFTLEVDKPMHIALLTVGNVKVGGRTNWESEAKVVSGYRLSGVIQGKPGVPNAPDAYCCTPAIASYLVGSMGDAYGENNQPGINELRASIGNHIKLIAGSDFAGILPVSTTTGGYRIQREAATVVGNPEANCKTTVLIGDRVAPFEEHLVAGSPIRVVSDHNNVVLVRDSNEEITYQIFDMNGRFIHAGSSNSTLTQINDAVQLSSGVYSVRINGLKKSETIKFTYFKN